MAIKQNEKTVTKVVKKIRQKVIVTEGGRMSSETPFKVIYSEFVESASAAKERVNELRKQYPDNSISYFSV